jgi:uridine kinase/predicted MPP superfamily phosphohydrolase
MKPLLVAIAGPSASGKSLLAHRWQAAEGKENCALLSLDSYYRDQSTLSPGERARVNYDEPSALDHELLLEHLQLLSAGHPVQMPVYDFATHTRAEETTLFPARPLILVEGLFALAFPEVRMLCARKIYVHLDKETCLHRRIERDTRERQRSPEEIRARYQQWVEPSLTQWVEPQKEHADVILDGSQPVESLLQICQEVLSTAHEAAQESSLPPLFQGLARRLGRENLGRRLELQASHWAGLTHQGEGLLAVERVVPLDTLVSTVLRWTGLAGAGLRGARDLRLEKNQVTSPAVPSGLDGLKILHLSDLHPDLETGIQPRLQELVREIDYDLAVITGDFRNSTQGNYTRAVAATRQLVQCLHGPVFGILGNHDFAEMVPLLEDIGIRMLLNEGVLLPFGQDALWLAGIDDPHFYQTHDWARVRRSADPHTFRLLLSHSPETYREAAAWFDMMLSGHTHGGQICLPGGIPLIRNGNCPGRLLSGAWRQDALQGYTSRGTGCCGVAARFFCPPEITLHTLQRSETSER